MAGRAPLTLGTYGKIRFLNTPGGVRADALVRDRDGKTRRVYRTAPTRAKARARLTQALMERLSTGSGPVGRDVPLSEVAEQWMAANTVDGLKPTTLEAYWFSWNGIIKPLHGKTPIGELTTSVCDAFLRLVVVERGPSTAKTARSVLSGILGYAVRNDMIDRNPVIGTGRIKNTPKKENSALTVAQVNELRKWLGYHTGAVKHDIPALVDFLIGTGVRIGEACGLLWKDVNLGEKTVYIAASVVRVTGKGLIRQVEASNKLKLRFISIPDWLVDELAIRGVGKSGDSPVFPSLTGGLRDPKNAERTLREAVNWAGMPGLTSHLIGRKTALTAADEAGVPIREMSDHAGHARISMTQDRYLGRRRPSRAVAEALEGLRPENG